MSNVATKNRPGTPPALGVASNGAGNGSAARTFTPPAGEGPVPKSALENMLNGIDPGKTKFEIGSNTPAVEAGPGDGADPNAAPAAGEGGAADGQGVVNDDSTGGTPAPPAAPGLERLEGETDEQFEARQAEANAAEAERQQAAADSGFAGMSEEVQGIVQEVSELLAAGQLQVGEVKRIGKLVVQLRQAEASAESLQAKVTDLEARLASAPAESIAASSTNPFAAVVKTGADLAKARAEVLDALAWVARNPNGGTYQGKEITAEQAVEIGIEGNAALQVHLPAREQELVNAQQVMHQRRTVEQNMRSHPKLKWAFNPEDPLGQRVSVWANMPQLKGEAKGPMIAVMLALGEKAFNEMVAANGAGAQGTARPAGTAGPTGNGTARPAVRRGLPSGGGSPAARAPQTKTEIAKAMETVASKRDRNSFATFLDRLGTPPARPAAGRR